MTEGVTVNEGTNIGSAHEFSSSVSLTVGFKAPIINKGAEASASIGGHAGWNGVNASEISSTSVTTHE